MFSGASGTRMRGDGSDGGNGTTMHGYGDGSEVGVVTQRDWFSGWRRASSSRERRSEAFRRSLLSLRLSSHSLFFPPHNQTHTHSGHTHITLPSVPPLDRSSCHVVGRRSDQTDHRLCQCVG